MKRRNFIYMGGIGATSAVVSTIPLSAKAALRSLNTLVNPNIPNPVIVVSLIGEVTAWISKELGVPVISSIDELGNWTIAINGGSPIPLEFTLAEVVVSTTRSWINDSASYGAYGDINGLLSAGNSAYFQTAGGSSFSGGPGSSHWNDAMTVATAAINSGLAFNEFYATLDAARLGQIFDSTSVLKNIFEKNPLNSLVNDWAGDFKGVVVLDKLGKVLGITQAITSTGALWTDLTDGDGQVSWVNVADVAISVGSLFVKSNLVGAALSMGWLLIKGEFEEVN